MKNHADSSQSNSLYLHNMRKEIIEIVRHHQLPNVTVHPTSIGLPKSDVDLPASGFTAF